MKLLTIELNNVSKKYRNKIIFNSLNLTIDNNKVNFLVSPNGVGKSTLIKMMLGLIVYKGTILTNCKSYAYCPEKVILPNFIKVIDFISLFDLNKEEALILLKKFNVDSELKISNLSKGMHQKIILVQCLTSNVDAYFFDEPLNGLDEESEKIFIEEIKRLYLNKKLIIISSHYLERYNMLQCNVIKL